MQWSNRAGLYFLMPAVIWVLIFTIFPLGYSAYLSLHDVDREITSTRTEVPRLDDAGNPILKPNGDPRTRVVVESSLETSFTWNGFASYVRAFGDEQVGSAVRITSIFVVVGVTTEMLLGLLLAFLYNRRIVGRPILRSIMILPIFATPIAIGYLFHTVFYEEGGPLAFLGIPWISHPDWALAAITVVDIWQWTPFCFLVFLAALQGIPGDLVECAQLDTSSFWDMLKSVYLPLLKPVIVIILLLRLAEALKLFDIIATLTKGGPGIATQSYTYYVYTAGFKLNNYGYASALAFMLLIVVMVIVTLFFKLLRKTYE